MKIREFCEQKLEALGFESRVKFELDDGSTFELIHPWLWDDNTQAAVAKAKSDTEMARAILGPGEHKRIIAAGGQNGEIVLAVELLKRQKIKDDAGASDPKDS